MYIYVGRTYPASANPQRRELPRFCQFVERCTILCQSSKGGVPRFWQWISEYLRPFRPVFWMVPKESIIRGQKYLERVVTIISQFLPLLCHSLNDHFDSHDCSVICFHWSFPYTFHDYVGVIGDTLEIANKFNI